MTMSTLRCNQPCHDKRFEMISIDLKLCEPKQ